MNTISQNSIWIWYCLLFFQVQTTWWGSNRNGVWWIQILHSLKHPKEPVHRWFAEHRYLLQTSMGDAIKSLRFRMFLIRTAYCSKENFLGPKGMIDQVRRDLHCFHLPDCVLATSLRVFTTDSISSSPVKNINISSLQCYTQNVGKGIYATPRRVEGQISS